MRWIVTLSAAVVAGMIGAAHADSTPNAAVSSAVQTPRVVSRIPTEPPATVAETVTAPSDAREIQQAQYVTSSRSGFRPLTVQRRSQAPFTRIMELERRKNAWLRSMFR